MALECRSSAKVNFILNILGKRPDGFHELETLMHPVPIHDHLRFERTGVGIRLTCDTVELPVGSNNLVWRAADAFLKELGNKEQEGIAIHLEKRIPLSAGLGGGSGNAAVTLTALNQLFGSPLTQERLHALAASLGSDVPFFLQNSPALATGRGEVVQPLPPFPALQDIYIFLVHPGFGVSTAWAYQHLVHFPEALHGKSGRALQLAMILQRPSGTLRRELFYNSLEAPVLAKHPLLQMYQEFMLENGASVALMSGSGSTTFALIRGEAPAHSLQEKFQAHFGTSAWTQIAKFC